MSFLTALTHRLGIGRQATAAAVLPEAVIIHLKGLTEAEAAPLEDDLQPLLAQLPETGSAGADQEGNEVSLYIYTEDAGAALTHLLPVLRSHPVSSSAQVTLQTRQPGSMSAMDFRRFPVQDEVPALEASR